MLKPTRIFYDWHKASEYAEEKEAAGYAVDICGGEHEHGQRNKYTVAVLDRTSKGQTARTMSPYFSAYTRETSTQIVNRMQREGRKPLRSKATIERLASKALRKHNIQGIKVSVKRITDDDGYTDAEARCVQTQKGGPKVFHELVIHPIHQYSRKGNLDYAIDHEIGHILKSGPGYADRGGKRLSRKPHKGWRKVKLA